MRLAPVLFLCTTFLALGLWTGLAAAAPEGEYEAKEWHFDLSDLLATYPEVEPNNTCATAQPSACGDVVDPARINPAGDHDWYSFSTTAGTLITVGTDQVAGQATMDTYIDLYRSDCATVLVSDDDSGPGFFSLISAFAAPYTGVYYLHVRGYSTSTVGYYKAFITCSTPVPPPPNDTCAGAIAIDRCTTGSLSGSTASATNDYDPGVGTPPPSCTGYTAAGRDVVYVMSLQAGDTVNMTYTQATADGSFYIITDCTNPNDSCVAGADATLSGQPETINFNVPSSGTYYLVLDSYGTGTGGNWTLTYAITCPALTGACCFPDGSCLVTTQIDCTAGVWQGPGTTCSPNPCPQPHGACCYYDGTCADLTQADCGATGGVWQGAGSSCSPNPCPQPRGACCYPSGACLIVTQAECETTGGTWQGAGTSCDPSPCALPTGACCYSDGTCAILNGVACGATGGVYQGDGSVCDPNPCPPPPPHTGACCFHPGGDCQVLTYDACAAAGGTYLGDDVGCNPGLCPPTAAESRTWGSVKKVYR